VKLIIATVLVIAVAIVFQNCSNVRLMGGEEIAKSSTASVTSLKATVCPMVEPQGAKNAKFIFVLDMSLSNIGGKAPNTGYFKSSLASDANGDRFKLVKDFMSSCGGSTDNQYAVIAFSNGAGRIRTIDGKLNFKCDGVFNTSVQAAADVDVLQNLQNQDKAYWAQYEGKPYFGGYEGIMGNTSYSQALDCVRDLVVNDLAGLNGATPGENYEVLFLSDGQPKDATAGDTRFKDLYDIGCESKGLTPGSPQYEACYLEGIDEPISFTMQVILGMNKHMRYHAIYYKSPTSTASVDALIEKFMGEIARVGGTFKAVILGLLKDEISTGNNPLCSLTQFESSLEFRPEVMTLVNLTMKRVGGKLEADSDIDGLSDEEEIALGSNPTNARSQVPGVLDGVCMKVGGFAQCLTKRNAITCSVTPNALGISDCDLQLLKIHNLFAHPDLGVDTDKDGMPDIVEILRGTDPGVKDMLADPDGDERTHKQEILENTETTKFDHLLDPSDKPNYTVRYLNREQSPICAYGAWQLHATTLPGISTKQLISAQPATFNHALKENVYLIFYRQEPTNSRENIQFYGAFVKSQYIPGTEFIDVILNKAEMLPADFIKLGEVMP